MFRTNVLLDFLRCQVISKHQLHFTMTVYDRTHGKAFGVPFLLVVINYISTTNLRHVVRITSIFYTFLLHVYAQKESIGLYLMSLSGMILRLGQEF